MFLRRSRDLLSRKAIGRFVLSAGSGVLAVFPVLIALLTVPGSLNAQIANRLPQSIDSTRTVALRNHHPLWANPANSIGVVPADASLNQFTLVLTRSAAQQQAFEQLLADQQNPASPEYHHWLTPTEIGERFGVSAADLAAIEGWLQSHGLHMNWVSPSHIFVGFGGSAADVGRAFGTELQYYNVNGAQRMSVANDPVIPQVLAPVIGALRGLYTIDDEPGARSAVEHSTVPELSLSGDIHFVVPNDFNTIYDVPAEYSGAGVTVGIVSWSRTNFADFDNFRQKTGTNFANPTEIVPNAFGGVDPGPAYTSPPSCNNCLPGQMEATLDVERVGSTAQGANILLVVSAPAGRGDGIGAGAQYLVNTSPVPAQVMNISFGACELSAGSAGVNFWNTLFQQAAAEGISVFVTSGDSGASGCESAFSPPQASPSPNSPNYICSSQYATCIGGTQFNDTSSPSTYWNSSNGTGYASAVSYIPEGAWNESTTTSLAGSGGGVSRIIPTPSWQTGTGVPTARAGRYTPDISFTSAGHDGYFGCMAAVGGSCAGNNFTVFSGTSAAAPGMAGIAALLDQKLGSAQGNLNPTIYALAASDPAAFHDATVDTSGVVGCNVNMVSICNNSAASRTSLSGGQAGYLLGVGYDEVTGLGSLDVTAFLTNYSVGAKSTPTVTVTPMPSGITVAQSLSVVVTVSGGSGNPTPTGSVMLTSGGYVSPAIVLNSGTATINISAGSLASGTASLAVTYSPDSSSSAIYNAATGTNTVMVTTTATTTTPTVTLTPSPASLTTTQVLSIGVVVSGGRGTPIPTGSIKLSSGGYVSNATALSNGTATIIVSAGMLAIGTDTLIATYTPDSASSATYNSASGAGAVKVTAPLSASFSISGTPITVAAGATSSNTSLITVTPINGFTGTVLMTASIQSSGTTNSPTVSFGSTTPVSISGTGASTATLTVTTATSQQSACAASNYPPRSINWYQGGTAVLGCVLLLGIGPRRRRKLRAAVSVLALLVALAGGAIGCGGVKKISCAGTTLAGTTAGNYTVTVTGTSGSTSASGTFILTVQ